MSSKHVIVRELDSLEDMGSISNICSDKTGTLTQGKIIFKSFWVPSLGWAVAAKDEIPRNLDRNNSMVRAFLDSK
jgi:magnesium-transporting ATPase (P-type)